MARYATAAKQTGKSTNRSLSPPRTGQPLQPRTRAKMDARFGHDFSSVRIHSDDSSARIAQSAGAKALTVGSHVLFGSGHYSPGSRAYQRLLSHELAHVVQQERSGPGDPTRMSQSSDPSEQEADKAADSVAAGASVQITAAPDAAIARDQDDKSAPADMSHWGEPNPATSPVYAPYYLPGLGAPMPDSAGPGDGPDVNWEAIHDFPGWDFTTNNAVSTGTSIAEEGFKNANQSAAAADRMSSMNTSISELDVTEQNRWMDPEWNSPDWNPFNAPQPGDQNVSPLGGAANPSVEPDLTNIDRITDRVSPPGEQVGLPQPGEQFYPIAPDNPAAVQELAPWEQYGPIQRDPRFGEWAGNRNAIDAEEGYGDPPGTPREPASVETAPASGPGAGAVESGASSGARDVEQAVSTGTRTEQAVQTGSRWANAAKVFNKVNTVMNPLGMLSNGMSMYEDIQQGHGWDALADASGFAGSGIGTASSLGLISETSALGPVGAAASSFAGGYAAGSLALGEANDYAKKNNVFGQDRDSSEAAADAGTWAQDKLHGVPYLPNFVGDVLGADVATYAAPVTALYSGGHAAVNGIENLVTGSPQEDNNIDIGSTMDQIDAKENESELYGNM